MEKWRFKSLLLTVAIMLLLLPFSSRKETHSFSIVKLKEQGRKVSHHKIVCVYYAIKKDYSLENRYYL